MTEKNTVPAEAASVWCAPTKLTTLMQVHDVLSRERPAPNASSALWLKYYRRSQALYAEIAEVDRGHHHEALYWSARERTRVEELEQRAAKKAADEDGE